MSEETKAALRRFGRVFLSTFLTTAFMFVEMFGGWSTIGLAFQVSIKNGFVVLYNLLILPLLTSSVAAAINAIAKLFRSNMETYRNKLEQLIAKIF